MQPETQESQEIANRLNLGRHQKLLTATDEEGRSGRWIVRRPNMRDEILIGVSYSQMKTPAGSANPVDIDEGRDNVAFMTATLNVVIDQRPEWFPKDASESFDGALIADLFNQYCEWKEYFRRRVSDASSADSGTPEST